MIFFSPLRCRLLAALLATSSALVGCGLLEPSTPSASGALNEQAARWLERARSSYRSADLDDARDAAQNALSNAPDSVEVKLTAARIHLARLEFDEVQRLLAKLQTPEALGLRGRARWYAGDVEGAADDLEALLADPQTKDEWAKTIARLARQGVGRKPFQISGGLLAPLQMQRIRSAHMIVPIEINGEQGLGLVATGRAEVVLDSSTRRDPSWVQLRFGERVEVRDVPALVEDLSGLSSEVGAPIKALLGVNLLRRLHVTFDFQGEQFVVRTREPQPPPAARVKATRVNLFYAQGGAMVTRVALRFGSSEQVPLLVNTLLPYPVALDERGLKVGGLEVSSLQAIPNDTKVRGGKLPYLRLGAFDVPEVPVVHGPSFTDIQAATGMDVDGAIGAGLLALFRCTLSDNGRVLWVEDNDQILQMLQQSGQPPPPSSGAAPPGPAPTGPAPVGPSPMGPSPMGPSPMGPSPMGPSPMGPAPGSSSRPAPRGP